MKRLGLRADRDGQVTTFGCAPGCLVVSIVLSVVLTIVLNVVIRLF